MLRPLAKPVPLVLTLGIATAIPILMSAVRLVQIPTGTLPQDTLRLAVSLPSLTLHALGGVLFGLLGPLQFARALRHRFGRLHRLSGWVFVVAGYGLGLSGLSLLDQVDSLATPLLDTARGLFGLALVLALTLAIRAAIRRDRAGHRDWMIRAYAIGMGSGTVALVMFPIYLLTGEPVYGLWSDIIFVLWWSLNIALAEIIIRHIKARSAA